MHKTSQNSAQLAFEKPKKRRTQAEKVGNWKYLWQRLDWLQRTLKMIDARTRLIEKGLKDFMNFEEEYINRVVCRDEVDQKILQRLLEASDDGVLPSRLAASLAMERVKRWDVTRRIQRMNKKLQKELGQNAAEKRGHRWAMSNFMRNVWGATIKEAQETGEETD